MTDYQRYFGETQNLVRESVRTFVAREISPNVERWEEAGELPRDLYQKAGDAGILGIGYPEQYGGTGFDMFSKIAASEEIMAAGSGGVAASLGSIDIGLPPVVKWGSDALKARICPDVIAGRKIQCLALTEPGGGSDVAGIRTTAVRDGDHYVVNGAKTFITGGMQADLVVVVARTSTDPDNRRRGLTLLVVEEGMDGFTRGRELEKMGCKVQDTAELSFVDVRVPAANVLGQVDEAFGYLGHNLPQERLTVAVGSVAQARSAIAAAIDYTQNRKVFGASVSSFQNTKFELAACSTEVEAAQAMLDRAVALHVEGELSGPDAARVKLFCTEMQQRVVDRCLQLFGGYGYMMEYPIARLYTDARVARIYAGTSEVMKVIIAKSLGL